MKKLNEFLIRYPTVLIFLNLAIDIIFMRYVKSPNIAIHILKRYLLAFKSLLIMYYISGKKVFTYFERKNALKAFFRLKVLWLVALVVSLLPLMASILSQIPVIKEWPIKFLTYFFLMVGAGLFEELSFRGVINSAIMKQFRNDKNVFVYIAFSCCFLFGLVHVIGADISSPIMLVTTIMKVVSAGIGGLVFLLTFWKYRNILGPALVHAAYDFLLFIPEIFFTPGMDLNIEYVSDGIKGQASIIVYLIQALLFGLYAYVIYKKDLRSEDKEKLRNDF